MDHHFKNFAQRLDTFTQSHHRQFHPEDRLVVIELYEELMSLMEGEADFSCEDQQSSMKITLTADCFLSSKDFPALQELIHLAAVFDANIQRDKIVFILHFHFWEWVPRELLP